MRIIDLHCYLGTQPWIDAQGPYPEALATYWKRDWVAKSEDEVIGEFTAAGVEACLVALDLASEIATDADVEARALAIASRIAALPVLAARFRMNVLLDAGLQLERKSFQLLFATAEKTEGIRARLERRAPRFS